MYYTYVIQNSERKRYIGQTKSIQDRLIMHNSTDSNKAKFHKTTFNKGPWKVVFYKSFSARKDALTFERFLKTGKGREWLKRECARLGG